MCTTKKMDCWVLLSRTLCQLMEELWHKKGTPLAFFKISILLISCLPNVSNKFYHGTKEDQLSAQHKRRTGECYLEEHCVSSWTSYDLKLGIPWHFLFVSILFISCLPNVSNKNYHNTGENQLSVYHIGVLASITFCQLMEQIWTKSDNPLAIFLYLFY